MVKKIIYVIVIVMMLFSISINCTEIYAADSVDEVIRGADSFLEAGEENEEIVVQEPILKNTSDFIFYLLLAIAMIVAVIVGIVIGIQFMMAGIDEKAKIKEALLPYFVGCVVVFGAFGIWKLAVTVLSKW